MDDKVMNDERRMSEVLEQSREELLELPEDSLVRANVQRGEAVVLTRTTVASFAVIEPMLDDELSPARAARRRAQARGLTDRALAFFAADLAREENRNLSEDQVVELSERVAGHDKYLLKWAWPLFGDDDRMAETLADIQRGRGIQDDAEDVIRLVELFRARWDQADGQTPVTLEYLTRAETDATALITLLEAGTRDKQRELARRAFNAWRNDYRDIMLLGRYLLQDQDNAAEMFPGIRARRNPPTRSQPGDSGVDDTDTDTDTDVLDETAGDTTGDVATRDSSAA